MLGRLIGVALLIALGACGSPTAEDTADLHKVETGTRTITVVPEPDASEAERR